MEEVAVKPVAVGDMVLVSTEDRREAFALVTAVHGTFPEEGTSSYVPCINVVFVTDDASKRDPYGAQLERMSSLMHFNPVREMPVPGRFWKNV